MLHDDSLQTIENLRLLREEDADKLLEMDKSDIIKYYEALLDKCHNALLKKREVNRLTKQSNLNL